ncbi:hypothetical protein ACHAW5_006254 [Stephanodiscus triporus]|uniref:C3H1-type domain-containing protein n=1 Tax=Stephanodiscus triporus TaxID=2934178 RepID=A0ABD3Q4B3_9STRA
MSSSSSFGGRGGGGGRGGRGRHGGHAHGGHAPSSTQPRLTPCRNYASTGRCHLGDRCGFSHVVRMLASVVVSDRIADSDGPLGAGGRRAHHGGGQHRGGGVVKSHHRATSVAVWEASDGNVKLFTGSHDGKWRLYDANNIHNNSENNIINNNNNHNHRNDNAAGTMRMEFEHRVGGPVDSVRVAARHLLFVAFESSPIEAPDARAGMVHGWNLDRPGDPPLELWMHPVTSRYAGSGRVRCVCVRERDGRVWSGGSDGVLREWTYAPGLVGGGGFAYVRGMGGHLGAVTSIALAAGETTIWSGGMDGTVRLWNAETGEPAHLIPAVGRDVVGGVGGVGGGGQPLTPSSSAAAAAPIVPSGAGHAGPVTGLLPFELPGGNAEDGSSSFVFTSSLDETVRVWNATNGECVASERHGQGVTAIALSSDLKGNPLLLCGLSYGDIMIRGTVSNPPLCLLLKISHNYLGVGHEVGPVNDIQPGPGNTFYAVADDGKLTAWQITGDFGL